MADDRGTAYAVYDEIARGGMASVHFGRLVGPEGFTRTVAIKRLRANVASEPEFVSMLLDEARCAGRIRHPNVVPTIDVVVAPEGVLLVLDYVLGVPLARLIRACHESALPLPADVASAIMVGVLHGLHAAHSATDERGAGLGIVHRDVSPDNILVGADGTPRLLDFGIAKAAGRLRTTRDGSVRGKLGYVAPEQLRGDASPRSDVFSAAVVLWELLANRRLRPVDDLTAYAASMKAPVERPSLFGRPEAALVDDVVLRALHPDPEQRYATAKEMAVDLESRLRPASATQVANLVEEIASAELRRRAALLEAIEAGLRPSLLRIGFETADGEATARIDAEAKADETALPHEALPTAPARPLRQARVLRLAATSIAVAALTAALFAARCTPETPLVRRQARWTPGVRSPADKADSHPEAAPRSIAAIGSTTPRLGPTSARGPGAPPASLTPPSCDPPYTLSEDGARKIAKRECFR